jgi:ADP-ribosylglycohydrolase
MKKILVLLLLGLLIFSCKTEKSKIELPSPTKTKYANDTLVLNSEVYYDKVLGALVGSAIGDAMGASTEMWHRKSIQLKYGYIKGLTPAVRAQSPEGTWDHNLMAGTTTDDTRWKYLMVKYLETYPNELSAANFATFIAKYYEQLTQDLAQENILKNTDSLDGQIEKIDWIKEWARVALAYQTDRDTYQEAQHRFYGGEMSCAGQLYTPMFGLVAENPSAAYEMAYNHALFDIGYAKDISALVSAMTNISLRTTDMDSILNTTAFVDPKGYQDSRLVGRIAYSILDGAQKNIANIRELVLIDSLIAKDSIIFKVPLGFEGSKKDWVKQEMVYQLLEKDERSIAFHSAEIWQILVSGLEFGEGDFLRTMQFIVNYGRDNDTVAAVAGMIMGAKDGFSNLPKEIREEVLRVNKENFGIDLEALAIELTTYGANPKYD